jgi:hypothetical protein
VAAQAQAAQAEYFYPLLLLLLLCFVSVSVWERGRDTSKRRDEGARSHALCFGIVYILETRRWFVSVSSGRLVNLAEGCVCVLVAFDSKYEFYSNEIQDEMK